MGREIGGIAGAVAGYYITGTAQGAQMGFVVGSTIGGVVDPPHFPGPRLGEVQLQLARDGSPIIIVWGTHLVVGNIIAMNPLVYKTIKTGGKKGGTGATSSEDHVYRTFAIGLGRGPNGPLGSLFRVWENNKLIYDSTPDTEFSWEDRQAFLQNVNIYWGSETQLPDPELESHSGVGTTPPYRGLAYIVFVNKDLTVFGAAIPQYRFEVSTETRATSRPYAVVGISEVEADSIVQDSYMIEGNLIPMEVDGIVTGVVLDHVVDYVTYDLHDDAEVDGTITAVALNHITNYIDLEPHDDAEVDGTVVSAVLNDRAGYIAYNPHDDATVDGIVTNILLITK